MACRQYISIVKSRCFPRSDVHKRDKDRNDKSMNITQRSELERLLDSRLRHQRSTQVIRAWSQLVYKTASTQLQIFRKRCWMSRWRSGSSSKKSERIAELWKAFFGWKCIRSCHQATMHEHSDLILAETQAEVQFEDASQAENPISSQLRNFQRSIRLNLLLLTRCFSSWRMLADQMAILSNKRDILVNKQSYYTQQKVLKTWFRVYRHGSQQRALESQSRYTNHTGYPV